MTNLTYRVYAAPAASVGSEMPRLAAVLGTGEPHESFFMGGDYYLWHVPGGEVRLLPNRQGPDDDEWFDADHPEVSVVIEVSVRGIADPIEPLTTSHGYSRLT